MTKNRLKCIFTLILLPSYFSTLQIFEFQKPDAPTIDSTSSLGYHTIENSDFPARYDYNCPFSKAQWGCVFSMETLAEARSYCDSDTECHSFIVMPHLKKPGWFIIIFKNESTDPVAHNGTTVYIKLNKIPHHTQAYQYCD